MKARHYENSEIAAIIGLTEAEIEQLLLQRRRLE